MYKVFLFSLGLAMIIGLSAPIVTAAEDVPNVNVTKRRPDRTESNSPISSPTPAIKSAEIKEIQTTNQSSFFARLWLSLKSFFADFFSTPTASTTIPTPSPLARVNGDSK